MSLSNIFDKAKCKQKFNYWVPKPSDHAQNQDVVIISTDYEEDSPGIYECNLRKNTLKKIYTYKHGFEILNHGQFIDSQNGSLYIFGEDTLGIFDLNTKEMNINTKSPLRDCNKNECPDSTYIPSPINEYHILTKHATHYIMDMNNKNINKMIINKFEDNNIQWPNISYIPFT
eukprot:186561_1